MLTDFINRWNGHLGVGDTPQNDGQCVGLVEDWFDTIGSPHIWGNACDLPTNAPRNAYDVILNTPEGVPSAGDVICWQAGWEGSAVGHTAIVVSANVNNFVVFEQNDRLGGGNGACRTHYFGDYTGVIGWLHPHALNAPAPVPPAPTVEAAPPPETPAPTDPVPAQSSAPAPDSAAVVTPDPSVTAESDTPAASPQTLPDPPSAPVEQPQVFSYSQVTPTLTPSQPHNTNVRKLIMVIPARLRSRKFWVAVVSAVGLVVKGDVNAAVAVIVAYFAAQGYVDAQTN